MGEIDGSLGIARDSGASKLLRIHMLGLCKMDDASPDGQLQQALEWAKLQASDKGREYCKRVRLNRYAKRPKY